MKRITAGVIAAISLAAFTFSAGVASADPVTNVGHQVAKVGRKAGHATAQAGRAGGHVVASSGRHVKHSVNGTSDYYNDHPGHAGYKRHHRKHHRHVVRHHH
ncbi:MAG: hypothetical protein JWP35_390 [Caulobacter sp.]|nr:hypothetical protein [Caulobacter sp.]